MGRGGGGKGNEYGGKGGGGVQWCDWTCPISTCAYKNWGSRERCRICEAHPGEGKRQPKGTGKDCQKTVAQRQIDGERYLNKQQKRLEQQNADLRRQLEQANAAKNNKCIHIDGGDDGDLQLEEEDQ